MKRRFWMAVWATFTVGVFTANAEIDPNKEILPGVKRGDTIIVEDPSAAIINPESFNVWTVWAGATAVSRTDSSSSPWIRSGSSIPTRD